MSTISIENGVRTVRVKILGKDCDIQLDENGNQVGEPVILDNSRESINLDKFVKLDRDSDEETQVVRDNDHKILACDGKRALSVHKIERRHKGDKWSNDYAIARWSRRGEKYGLSSHIVFNDNHVEDMLYALQWLGHNAQIVSD